MSESAPVTTGGLRSSDADGRPSGTALALADGLSLLAFVGIGLRSHRIGAIAEIAARNAVPLALTWTLAALIVGVYRLRDLSSLVITWVIAVPVALLIRTWWVGSPQGGRLVVFLAVGLVITLLFLLIGRGLVWAVTRSRPLWRRRP